MPRKKKTAPVAQPTPKVTGNVDVPAPGIAPAPAPAKRKRIRITANVRLPRVLYPHVPKTEIAHRGLVIENPNVHELALVKIGKAELID